MSSFYWYGPTVYPPMVYYDQFTGLLSPVMSTFIQQPVFESSLAFSTRTTLGDKIPLIVDSEPKQNPDTLPDENKNHFDRISNIQKEIADISDDEYVSEYGGKSSSIKPLKRKKKTGTQNQNRNIIPNIIQQIFSYLSKAKKSRVLCEKVVRHHPIPHDSAYSVSRFYIYHKLIKENMNHYVNQNTLSLFHEPNLSLSDIFSEKQQQYYLTITRVMVAYFLNNISPLLTIKSKRMGKEKRIEHLRARRFLFSKLKSPSMG